MRRLCLTTVVSLLACLAMAIDGHADVGSVHVLATGGDVQFSPDGTEWETPEPGDILHEGAILRTGVDGFIDLLVAQSGASLRLPAESELHVDRLRTVSAGETSISTTRLELPRGTLIGSQPKLPALSTFEVATPAGTASLNATEYVVRSDGAVSVLTGSVSVRFNEPHAGGSVFVTVNPGQSFDPATGEVVTTSPDFLEDLIAEVETTRRNAEVYKVPGATVVVKPEEFISPTRGNAP